jgi:hypothetical protein
MSFVVHFCHASRGKFGVFGWFLGAVTTTRFLIAPGPTVSLSPTPSREFAHVKMGETTRAGSSLNGPFVLSRFSEEINREEAKQRSCAKEYELPLYF